MLSVGQSIYLWRLEKGYSQAQLANSADILQPNLSRIEKDKLDITLGTLKRIATALSIKPGQLVDGPLPFNPNGIHKLTRKELENIAVAIVSDAKISANFKPLVEVFKILTTFPSNKVYSTKKILWAWIKAKSILSKEYINALLAKIDEAKQLS